jgi:hypothetical protein
MSEEYGASERALPQTVVEALRRTKEVLQERGRGRGEDLLKDGRVCLVGALYIAAGVYGADATHDDFRFADPSEVGLDEVQRRDELALAAVRLLDKVSSRRSTDRLGAVSYNDADTTTDEDVASLIDDAIRLGEQNATDS